MTLHNRNRFGRAILPLLAAFVLFATVCCHAQHSYIGRYDAFVGFSDINAPYVNNLNQPGFAAQGGFANNRWLSSGLDYSRQSGTGPFTASLLPANLQKALAGELPPGYTLSVPTDVTIQTFAAGSQLVYRRFAKADILIHPVLCALHIDATLHPGDPVAAAVIGQLVPSGKKHDWTGGYGVGGGTDLHFLKHLGVRMQTDLVWSHPVNDLLGRGFWIYRFSVGPSLHFGRNIDTGKGK
ncbi:MAG: hypothetical protein ACLPY1_22790 [Terracidiphilus sp.]